MTTDLIWRPEAQADLLDLYDWIAVEAGRATALAYTAAIEGYVAKLIDLPGWGTPRDELGPGIRTIAYRRRTTIAFRELPGAIEMVRLAHAGRDLGRMFEGDG